MNTNYEKDFVPYEQALALKELGFDEPCFGFYTYKGGIRRYTNFDGELNDFQTLKNSSIIMGNGWCAVPTFSQAFRWFREKHELYSFVFKFDEGFGYETYKEGVTQTNESFDTYEEAELACLKKLIEIVKQQL